MLIYNINAYIYSLLCCLNYKRSRLLETKKQNSGAPLSQQKQDKEKKKNSKDQQIPLIVHSEKWLKGKNEG